MNCLSDVKKALDLNHVEIESFNGHTLVSVLGTFMLSPTSILLNGKEISDKEFHKMIIPKVV